jgi:hypothetical protein
MLTITLHVPTCARCLKKDAACYGTVTRYRTLPICPACRTRADHKRWIARYEHNRELLGPGFISLDDALIARKRTA